MSNLSNEAIMSLIEQRDSLNDRNNELEEDLETTKKLLEESLNLIGDMAKIDNSANAPDLIWLNNWRNNTKQRAMEFIAKLSKEEM